MVRRVVQRDHKRDIYRERARGREIEREREREREIFYNGPTFPSTIRS